MTYYILITRLDFVIISDKKRNILKFKTKKEAEEYKKKLKLYNDLQILKIKI